MRNFELGSKRRKISESTPALVFLGIVVLIFAWSVFRFWTKMATTGRNRELAEAKAEMFRQQKSALEMDLAKLQTDRGKEEFFRENYGLAKEGEEVIIIVEDKSAPVEPPRGALSGFFSRFLNLFK